LKIRVNNLATEFWDRAPSRTLNEFHVKVDLCPKFKEMTETLCKNLRKGGKLVMNINIKTFDQRKLEDVDVNGIDAEFITYKGTYLGIFKRLITRGLKNEAP
jgi:hypothetical protein